MTGIEPDEYLPVSAANYDSFAGFANKAQSDWEAEIYAGTADHFSPWSGVCALLMQVPFLGDLITLGGGPDGALWGPIGALFDGLVYIAESVCALFLGTPPDGDATPSTILDVGTNLFDSLLDNPFIEGLIVLAEDTGNLISDIIMSALTFIADICSLFTGTTAATTPQTIQGGIEGVFDMIAGSGFLSGLIDLATTSGSLILELLDGIVNLIDALWNAIVQPFLDVFMDATPTGLLSWVTDIATAFIEFLVPIVGLTTNAIAAFFRIITDIVNLLGRPFGIGQDTDTVVGGLGSIPILGPIVSQVQNFFDRFVGVFTGILTVGNPLTIVTGVLSGFVDAVFGFFDMDAGTGTTGTGQITNNPLNLLLDGLFGGALTQRHPTFNDPATFDDIVNAGMPGGTPRINGWATDAATSDPRAGGAGGSASVALNGSYQSLISNSVSVMPGSTVHMSVSTKYTGLVGDAGGLGAGAAVYNSSGQLLGIVGTGSGGGGG